MSEEISTAFSQIASIIENSKNNALKKVNEELINMYWNIGEFLSREAAKTSFGDAYIDSVSEYIQKKFPGIKGFTRRGLYRMKQFYETYCSDEFVSPLVSQITWTNHLIIMSSAKSVEERHFYLQLCIKEQYSKRELERQIDSAYYERYMLSQDKMTAEIAAKDNVSPFLDTYVLDFLSLPKNYKERDFQKAILANLKDFILEVGKDFAFIGQEHKVEVGNRDFYIDLLFYHRGLSCLVAFELKIGRFEPEYVSKMDFYLEALDRQYRKESENPSVGVILCASKDDEVVEYALSRTLSPTMVADYTLQLPDKKVLQEKLKELTVLAEEKAEETE